MAHDPNTTPQPLSGTAPEMDQAEIYPSQHHFRIIVQVGTDAPAQLEALLSAYCVIGALEQGRASSAGRYQALGVSVLLHDRDEHLALDAAIRQIEGVKILL